MRQARILVIDDEISMGKVCQFVLADANHLVEVYTAGRQGIAAFKNHPYDVVLVDMKLPDVEGIEVLKSIHETAWDTQVVVMTGYSTVQNAVEAMKAGAYDYLPKPFTDDTLIRTVEKALEKKRLMGENRRLRSEQLPSMSFDKIIGNSPKILDLFEQVEKVAPTDATVLLYGESGTGKELFARAIHRGSTCSSAPFIVADCNTFSPNLLESELFGHMKGSFTGSTMDKPGIFEIAGGGSLFLDEVTNLTLDFQGKLLRVVETGEFKPVGASRSKTANVRIIAATNRDLKAMVDDGNFRSDLYYRLNVFPLVIPPLRERRQDIPELAYHYLRIYCRKTGKGIEGFSDEAMESLMDYDWPGNVRQLRNIIERLVILSDQTTIDVFYLLDHLRMKGPFDKNPIPASLIELNASKKHLMKDVFGQIQKAFLMQALKSTNGNISRAAQKVGMQRPNFCALLKSHHISIDRIASEKKK
jgi:DNA-binding NtrC family response regulator